MSTLGNHRKDAEGLHPILFVTPPESSSKCAVQYQSFKKQDRDRTPNALSIFRFYIRVKTGVMKHHSN